MDTSPEKVRLLHALRASGLTTKSRAEMIDRFVELSSGEEAGQAEAAGSGGFDSHKYKVGPQQRRLHIRMLVSAGVPWSEVQPHLLALVHETSDDSDVAHYVEMAAVAGDNSAAVSLFASVPKPVAVDAWCSVHQRVRQTLIEWIKADEQDNGKSIIWPFIEVLIECQQQSELDPTPGQYLLLAKVLLRSCSGHAVASFVHDCLDQILRDLRTASIGDGDQVNATLTSLAEHCAWVGSYSVVKALLTNAPEGAEVSSRHMALLAEAAAALQPGLEFRPPAVDWRQELQNALNRQLTGARSIGLESDSTVESLSNRLDSSLVPNRSVSAITQFLERNSHLSAAVLMRLAHHEANQGHFSQCLEVLRVVGLRWHYTNQALAKFADVADKSEDSELGDEGRMVLEARVEWGRSLGVAFPDRRNAHAEGVRQPKPELTSAVLSFWDDLVKSSTRYRGSKLDKAKSASESSSSPSIQIRMEVDEWSAASAACRQAGVPPPPWKPNTEVTVVMPDFIDAFSETSWSRIFLCLYAAFSATKIAPEISLLLTTLCCGSGRAAMENLTMLRVPVSLRWNMESWLLSRQRFEQPNV